MGKYDDIINLPHHVSDYHKPMPIESRAAQFAPFAALTGHDEAIAETMRTTEEFKEISDYEKSLLAKTLSIAFRCNRLIEVTYFKPDKTKNGGIYDKVIGHIKKLDEYDNILKFDNGISIPIKYISDIIIIK